VDQNLKVYACVPVCPHDDVGTYPAFERKVAAREGKRTIAAVVMNGHTNLPIWAVISASLSSVSARCEMISRCANTFVRAPATAAGSCSPRFAVPSFTRMTKKLNTSQKFFSQTDTTLLIPVVGFPEILLDFGSKDQVNGHGYCESCTGFLPTRGPSPGR